MSNSDAKLKLISPRCSLAASPWGQVRPARFTLKIIDRHPPRCYLVLDVKTRKMTQGGRTPDLLKVARAWVLPSSVNALCQGHLDALARPWRFPVTLQGLGVELIPLKSVEALWGPVRGRSWADRDFDRVKVK
jgi:hypothetical protein